MTDVVCFGEVFMSFQTDSNDVSDPSRVALPANCRLDFGGSAFTAAVGFGNLLRSVRMVSVLPVSFMSSNVLKQAAAAGVDMSHIVMDESLDAETGAMFSIGGTDLFQHRHSSFCRRVDGRDYDWTPIFKDAGALYCSALSASVSQVVRAATGHCIKKAHLSRVPVVLDASWNPDMFSDPALLHSTVKAALPYLTLLVLNEQALYALAKLEGVRTVTDDAVFSSSLGGQHQGINMFNNPFKGIRAAVPPAERMHEGNRVEVIVEKLRAVWKIPFVACCVDHENPATEGGRLRWSAVASAGGRVSARDAPVQHRPIDRRGSVASWVVGFVNAALEQKWFGYPTTMHRQLVFTALREADAISALAQEHPGPLCSVPREVLSRTISRHPVDAVLTIGTAADSELREKIESALRMHTPLVPEITKWCIENQRESSEPGGLCTVSKVESIGNAIAKAGVKVVEIRWSLSSTENMTKMVERLKAQRLLVGASGVTNKESAFDAVRAGVDFVVTPGVLKEVASVCALHGIPLYPLASTPTEISSALGLQMTDIGLFPAESLGGLEIVSSLLKNLFPTARFIPQGVRHPEKYLALDNVFPYVKYPLTKAFGSLVQEGKYSMITTLMEEKVASLHESKL